MSKTPKPEPDDKEQSERFIETAKELEADKNKGAFERAFGIIIQPDDEKKKSDSKSA